MACRNHALFSLLIASMAATSCGEHSVERRSSPKETHIAHENSPVKRLSDAFTCKKRDANIVSISCVPKSRVTYADLSISCDTVAVAPLMPDKNGWVDRWNAKPGRGIIQLICSGKSASWKAIVDGDGTPDIDRKLHAIPIDESGYDTEIRNILGQYGKDININYIEVVVA